MFVAHLYIVVQGVRQKVSFFAEPVEKVQTANSDNLGTVKKQPVSSHRKIQNAHFRVFRQARYISICFPIMKKVSIKIKFLESGCIISPGNEQSLR